MDQRLGDALAHAAVLARSLELACKLFNFPDAESLGIKCPRVRGFIKTALENSGSEFGRSGVPGEMVLEHRRMVAAAMSILGRVRQPTLIVHSRQDDYAALNNAEHIRAC